MKPIVRALNIFLIVTFIIIPTFVSAKDEDKFNHRVALSSFQWGVDFFRFMAT